MNAEEHAAAVLFLVARVLHEAVESGQQFTAEQFSPTRPTGSVLGKDGRQYATCEPSGEYKFVLTVEPLQPDRQSTQIKADLNAEANCRPELAST
jgi:hypothetical protein